MRPSILGILNMTADSFSDGGQFLSPDDALAQARYLHENGSDILDIGPASSHPDSQPVSAETEIERLQSVVPQLLAQGRQISIDSFQPKTQIWAAAQGVAWLNDIQGFADPQVQEALADYDCNLFIMHSIQSAGPAKREQAPAGDIWDAIEAFLMRVCRRWTRLALPVTAWCWTRAWAFSWAIRPKQACRLLGK